MKFDYVIGNPPYNSGTEKDTRPIWPKFVDETNKISDIQCMIHPGRWVVPTSKYTSYRDNLLKNHLRNFILYEDSDSIFPTLRGISGGVTITFFDKNFIGNPTYTINNDKKQREYDINKKIFLNNFEEEVYTKVFNKLDVNKTLNDRVLNNGFGYSKHKLFNMTRDNSENMKDPIKVYTNNSFKSYTGKYVWKYIEKTSLDSYSDKLFSSRKILLSTIGDSLKINASVGVYNKIPMIIDKNATAENHIFIYPEHDTDRELKLIQSLLLTKTARYLMCISQKGQAVRGFENIPDYIELAKLLPEDELFTDKWFYKTFDFSKELVNEIESRISEKTDEYVRKWNENTAK